MSGSGTGYVQGGRIRNQTLCIRHEPAPGILVRTTRPTGVIELARYDYGRARRAGIAVYTRPDTPCDCAGQLLSWSGRALPIGLHLERTLSSRNEALSAAGTMPMTSTPDRAGVNPLAVPASFVRGLTIESLLWLGLLVLMSSDAAAWVNASVITVDGGEDAVDVNWLSQQEESAV